MIGFISIYLEQVHCDRNIMRHHEVVGVVRVDSDHPSASHSESLGCVGVMESSALKVKPE